MSDDACDFYLNYVHQLRNTLSVISAEPETQCSVMGSYNAPWELKTDASDFIDAVLSLQKGRLAAETASRLIQFKQLLQELPIEAVNPAGQVMTTREGCLVALGHPSWNAVRVASAALLPLITDPFPE